MAARAVPWLLLIAALAAGAALLVEQSRDLEAAEALAGAAVTKREAASEELETGLVGRAAGLQRRADALRQSDVLDPSARQRLLRGIAR